MGFDTGPIILCSFYLYCVLHAEPLPLVIEVSELVCRMTSDESGSSRPRVKSARVNSARVNSARSTRPGQLGQVNSACMGGQVWGKDG